MQVWWRALRSAATAIALLSLGGTLLADSAQGNLPALQYVIRPVLDKGKVQSVSIRLTFRGSEKGVTVLDLPRSWGGFDELYKGLTDFAVHGRRAVLEAGEQPWQRTVRHAPGALLRVEYRVLHSQAAQGDKAASYRPFITSQRIYLIGQTVFVTPAGLANDHPVNVSLRGFPRDWQLVSDLQAPNLTAADLWDSNIAAGDFRVVESNVSRASLRLAIHGQWSISDTKFVDLLAQISNAQHAFWGDEPGPYLVTLMQVPGKGSGRGSEIGDAFIMVSTADIDPFDHIRVLAHERLHAWIPKRIGTMPDGDAERSEYWLSEGFTDYYTIRMLVRAGVWSAPDAAKALNTALSRYAGSPVRDAPNRRIATEFWSNGDVGQLPYDRGLLIAAMVDHRLRLRTEGKRSLDDVMLSMRRRFQSGGGPIREEFLHVLDEHGVDARTWLADWVEAGRPILLPSDIFAPCGTVETEDLPMFHRGFDADATAAHGMVIAGVATDLPAYAAGMRDGMTLLGREAGVIGDPLQQIAYRIRDPSGVERVIKYWPHGRERRSTQSLRLAPDLHGNTLQACMQRLGAVQ